MNTNFVSSVFVTFGLFLAGADALGSSEMADRVLVEKAAHRLTLLRDKKIVCTYQIALGTKPTGRKECQGDNRTPEGLYTITGRNRNSQFHRSLRISYPNDSDRATARKRGCNPGGDIMIHGLPNGQGSIGKLHSRHDWTQGCIALTNEEIEKVWQLVPDGTPIEIRP